MDFLRLGEIESEELKQLQTEYKSEIGEAAPKEEDFLRLFDAINKGQILFYGCRENGKIIACCSVCPTFSSFDYRIGGIFEDFYIVPEYRNRGIAGKLLRYAFEQSKASTLIVGCASCDVDMYKHLGFKITLGSMLAFEN